MILEWVFHLFSCTFGCIYAKIYKVKKYINLAIFVKLLSKFMYVSKKMETVAKVEMCFLFLLHGSIKVIMSDYIDVIL